MQKGADKYCDWCGKYMGQANYLRRYTVTGAVAGHLMKDYCSKKCRLEAESSNGSRSSSGAGGGGGVISHALGLSETAEEREERLAEEAEERAEKAERKARIQAINDIVFDTENEQTFVQQVISLCEDYKGLKAGVFADKDLKAAYTNRIKKEFAVLSATKSDLLARVKGFWEDAEKAMKKKNKPRHIIAIALPIIIFLVSTIWGIAADEIKMGLGTGVFLAIIGGGMIGVLIEGYNS